MSYTNHIKNNTMTSVKMLTKVINIPVYIFNISKYFLCQVWQKIIKLEQAYFMYVCYQRSCWISSFVYSNSIFIKVLNERIRDVVHQNRETTRMYRGWPKITQPHIGCTKNIDPLNKLFYSIYIKRYANFYAYLCLIRWYVLKVHSSYK